MRRLSNEIIIHARESLQQLASGLHHLHESRIVHRDIKPQNILIAYPKRNQNVPRLVISDFGLCRSLPDNASTLLGTVPNAGTIGWKAPELIQNPLINGTDQNSTNGDNASTNSNDPAAQGVKRAVDVFSLGCLFFYVLTNGAHPFDQEDAIVWPSDRERNVKMGRSNFSKLKDLGGDAEEPMQLIKWMLSPRPEDRPTAHQVKNHPFFWSPAQRLAFLCDVSDHWEHEPREPPSPHLLMLESFGEPVHGGDFLRRLDRKFIDTLGKQRKYTTDKMLDLLRALRNKKNHYIDMPDDVKARVGPMPEGYLRYWTDRFPLLLMACYNAVLECGLVMDHRFRPYLEAV